MPPAGALLLAVPALVLLLGLAIFLYDRSRRHTIADGVRIDGVSVAGLSESAARTRVEALLVPRVDQPVTVRAGERSWTLGPREAEVHVDVAETVARAVAVSREGSIFTRTFRGLFGGTVNRDIPLAVSYSHAAVRRLAATVRSAVDRPPVDATVEPSSSGLRAVPAHDGLTVDYRALGARIEGALADPSASRSVRVPAHHLRPKVTTANLAAKYPAYIVIDRATFRLRFYNHLKLERTYEIAVGMEGLETPAGLHHIEWEQVNPPWYVPKKAWAGALAGTVVPPGPADPLKARFMSFEGGAGIHGIDPSEYETIGHDASHGCVRMRIPDVIDLYSKTPVGTPVFII
jgi:lipoprotein-anchoring transpeptidase ErfK/SrfK